MPATLDLRRGQVTGDASRRWLTESLAAAPNKPIMLSGDVSGTGTSAIATTLATVNTNLGTFQGLTVNGKGLVTAAANQTGQQPGTATNNNATAGNVGEFISATVNAGVTASTITNLTTISLTAGDWDISGSIEYAAAAGLTDAYCCVSTTSGDVSQSNMLTAPWSRALNISAVTQFGVTPPRLRLSLASPTTVYLVAFCNFPSGTCTANGAISARRMR